MLLIHIQAPKKKKKKKQKPTMMFLQKKRKTTKKETKTIGRFYFPGFPCSFLFFLHFKTYGDNPNKLVDVV